MGHGYDQTSPSQFIYQLWLLLLSGKLVSPYANVTHYEKCIVLTSSCIEGLINMKKESKTADNTLPENLFPSSFKTTSKLKVTFDTALSADIYSSV